MILDIQPLPVRVQAFRVLRCDTCEGDRPHREIPVKMGRITVDHYDVCNACHPMPKENP